MSSRWVKPLKFRIILINQLCREDNSQWDLATSIKSYSLPRGNSCSGVTWSLSNTMLMHCIKINKDWPYIVDHVVHSNVLFFSFPQARESKNHEHNSSFTNMDATFVHNPLCAYLPFFIIPSLNRVLPKTVVSPYVYRLIVNILYRLYSLCVHADKLI